MMLSRRYADPRRHSRLRQRSPSLSCFAVVHLASLRWLSVLPPRLQPAPLFGACCYVVHLLEAKLLWIVGAIGLFSAGSSNLEYNLRGLYVFLVSSAP